MCVGEGVCGRACMRVCLCVCACMRVCIFPYLGLYFTESVCVWEGECWHACICQVSVYVQ